MSTRTALAEGIEFAATVLDRLANKPDNRPTEVEIVNALQYLKDAPTFLRKEQSAIDFLTETDDFGTWTA